MYPRKDSQVIDFIEEFANRLGVEPFMNGYCWHFAHILKSTFNRGKVCWNTFSHFVWLDDTGIAYDIEGIYEGDNPYYVPEEFLGEALLDFKHIPDEAYCVTEEGIAEIHKRYKESKECKYLGSIVSEHKDYQQIEECYKCQVISYQNHPNGVHYFVLMNPDTPHDSLKRYADWGADGKDYVYRSDT